MKLSIIKKLLFLIVICIPLTVLSCSNTSKKITLSENTENEISLEESEIIKSITAGEKLLDEGKLEEAKENFSKAISLDKTNKDTYLRIKDKYISVNKLDEAYNIVKSAISNNVDIENMKLVLKEISSKFEVIKISNSVYQNGSYALPKEVNINVSDISISIPVAWSNENIDTNNVGTFTYEGYNDDYGRKIIVELTVMENIYDKQIGCIENIYTSNGKTYIDVDLIEFYTGEQALNEAKKDNMATYDEAKGEYFIPFGYYIRNNTSTITTYEVSKDCIFQLFFIDLFALGYDSESYLPQLNTVSYETFKSYIDMRRKMYLDNKQELDGKIITKRTTLCWIELKNNNVYYISRNYL